MPIDLDKRKSQTDFGLAYYVNFFCPLNEVKASQMKNDKLVSSARAFTFAQRVKKLNIVGLIYTEGT
jgi:hypothetical protein